MNLNQLSALIPCTTTVQLSFDDDLILQIDGISAQGKAADEVVTALTKQAEQFRPYVNFIVTRVEPTENNLVVSISTPNEV